MSAFDAPKDRDDIITVRDKKNWDPHESCRIRTVKRGGDEEWVTNQLLRLKSQALKKQKSRSRRNQQTGIEIESNLAAANRLWVQRMLVDWTFTKNGVPMPINDQSMAMLDQSYIDYIYDQLQDAQPEDDDEEEESEEDDEEGSAFFANASDSTDGDIDPQEEMESEERNNRNYLLRS